MLKDETALELAKLLKDHRGNDVLVMDMQNISGWTDFFVIATVTSSTHLQGLERQIKEFCGEKGIDILRSSPRKPNTIDDEWLIIDLGSIAVHLMSSKTRNFYELERLWSAAAIIFHNKDDTPTLGNL